MRGNAGQMGKAFSECRAAHAEHIDADIRQVGEAMNEGWREIDEGWQNLERRLLATGVVKAASYPEEDIMSLNVGGVPINVRRLVLEGLTLGDLFEGVWDERIPRDAEGRIVVDESPVCVKHLIDTLKKGAGDVRMVDSFAVDETAHLNYISSILGAAPRVESSIQRDDAVLPPSKVPKMIFNTEESTMLTPTELGQLMGHLLQETTCFQDGGQVELLYSASRDGMNPEAFYSRCGYASPSTLTLVRSKESKGSAICVCGGFSDVPWTGSPSAIKMIYSDKAFTFFYSRGTGGTQKQICIYKLKEGHRDRAILLGPNFGPSFGAGDLNISFDGNGGASLVVGEGCSFAVPRRYEFLYGMGGGTVLDFSVYRVHDAGLQPSLSVWSPDAAGICQEEVEYIRRFGVSMASSLMEERAALRKAQAALAKAQDKAAAALRALEAVYGPDIASGKKDEVVELSVRGTRMTTLRSTLTLFPDSVFVTWFNGNWQPTPRELDEHGRRIVDCSPKAFSKVLDILRMKKRLGWVVRGTQGHDGDAVTPVPVIVRQEDRACFIEFVNMYFPGSENVILDLVKLTVPVEATDEKHEP